MPPITLYDPSQKPIVCVVGGEAILSKHNARARRTCESRQNISHILRLKLIALQSRATWKECREGASAARHVGYRTPIPLVRFVCHLWRYESQQRQRTFVDSVMGLGQGNCLESILSLCQRTTTRHNPHLYQPLSIVDFSGN